MKFEHTTLAVISTEITASCKSSCHTITRRCCTLSFMRNVSSILQTLSTCTSRPKTEMCTWVAQITNRQHFVELIIKETRSYLYTQVNYLKTFLRLHFCHQRNVYTYKSACRDLNKKGHFSSCCFYGMSFIP